MCDDKVTYSNLKQAKLAAHLVANKHKGRELRSYECPDCHGFHLTSIPGKHAY